MILQKLALAQCLIFLCFRYVRLKFLEYNNFINLGKKIVKSDFLTKFSE